MTGDLLLLVSLIAAAFAGALGHELAHWIVWRVTGRNPRLDIWGLCVQPRAGPRRTTAGDRVAAASPYAIGLACLLAGLDGGVLPLVAFGGAMVQIPSKVDVATIRGQTEWLLSASDI